jgi:hypothetical protein
MLCGQKINTVGTLRFPPEFLGTTISIAVSAGFGQEKSQMPTGQFLEARGQHAPKCSFFVPFARGSKKWVSALGKAQRTTWFWLKFEFPFCSGIRPEVLEVARERRQQNKTRFEAAHPLRIAARGRGPFVDAFFPRVPVARAIGRSLQPRPRKKTRQKSDMVVIEKTQPR